MAVAGEDFVVVGGDTRLSEGYSIVTRNESKLVQLTDKTILATSGMFADFCELTKVLAIPSRSWRQSSRSMTLKLNASPPLNPSLTSSPKHYILDDFSHTIHSTWLQVSTKMAKVSFTVTTQLVVTVEIVLWRKAQGLTWSYPIWTTRWQDTTILGTRRSLPFRSTAQSIWCSMPLDRLPRGTSIPEISCRF